MAEGKWGAAPTAIAPPQGLTCLEPSWARRLLSEWSPSGGGTACTSSIQLLNRRGSKEPPNSHHIKQMLKRFN